MSRGNGDPAPWDAYWQRRGSTGETYSNEGRVLRNLLRLTDLRGSRVLEVGAGTGRDSLDLAERGARVYRVDRSMAALRVARREARRRRIHAAELAADAFRLPFHAGTFDIVFHQGLLEHFSKSQEAKLLRENIRVLKEGGLLLVDVPQRFHPYTILKHMLIALDAWFAGWEREFSLRELERDLTSLHVVPVRAYGVWMVPSLAYRILRQGLLKLGIRLPMYPVGPPLFARIRRAVRERALRRRLFLNTCFCIGVIARRVREERGIVGDAARVASEGFSEASEEPLASAPPAEG